MVDYEELTQQAEALIAGVPHRIANLANLSALIFGALPDLNWAGFYLLEGETLVLGPFQGKPACIEIPIARGVCGAAVREDRPQLVMDVHAFKGHIACSSKSKSEIVVPIIKDNNLIGVIDIDSPIYSRFSSSEKEFLEKVAALIAKL